MTNRRQLRGLLLPIGLLGVTGILLSMCAQDRPASVTMPSRSPVVANLSPTSGSVGTEVTVTGEGFTSSTNTIKFGAGYINGLSSSDGMTLRFTVPEGQNLCPPTSPSSPVPCPGAYPRVTPGSYSTSVLNANGTSNDLPFTVRGQ
jgi:hypothetical protein